MYGWWMKDERWRKDEEWKMKCEEWRIKDEKGFADRQTDKQTFVIVKLISWLKMLALIVFLVLV